MIDKIKGDINFDEAKEKKLIINDNDDLYQKLQKVYQYIFEYYLDSFINIKKYEQEINNSNLYIGKNPDFKHLNEYWNNDYIFLINAFFVEKLDKSDIDVLLNADLNNIKNEEIEIIKRTFKDIIWDNYRQGKYQDDIIKICYWTPLPNYVVDNNDLVLVIYYGRNLINLENNKFFELHKKQLEFFNKIKEEIQKDLLEKVGVKSTIFIEKVM